MQPYTLHAAIRLRMVLLLIILLHAIVGRVARSAGSHPTYAEALSPISRVDRSAGSHPTYAKAPSPESRVDRSAGSHPTYIPTPTVFPDLPDNDVLLPPDLAFGAAQTGRPAGARAKNSVYQTSEFMLGSVQVDVFLPESNGAIDAQTETWTPAQIKQVTAQINRGLQWWVDAAVQGGRPAADLSFQTVFHTPANEPDLVATAYEPIQRPHWEEYLWIEEIMGRIGYAGSHYDAARRYAHDRRTAAGCDWGFTIWVVNSDADPDGRFSDGFFAYSYLYGPFFIMTYDNNGWSPNFMEIVTAHETAHVFGALDEYAASGCSDQQVSGYLSAANVNCENGDPATELSIMRNSSVQFSAYPRYLASTPVRSMVGWRDLDGDGRYDPVDTVPSLSLSVTPEGVNAGEALTLSGVVEDTPWVSTNRAAVSINSITAVQFRIDGGAWGGCIAQDGKFDQASESYRCTLSDLSAGGHMVGIRAVNRAGIVSAVARFTLDADGLSMPWQVYLPLVRAEVLNL